LTTKSNNAVANSSSAAAVRSDKEGQHGSGKRNVSEVVALEVFGNGKALQTLLETCAED